MTWSLLAVLCLGGSLAAQDSSSTEGVVATTTTATTTTEDPLASCRPVPEVLYLHDASTSLLGARDAILGELNKLLDEWQTIWQRPIRMGFGSWTDKPIPGKGWGGRAALRDGADIDYCYHLGVGLSDNTTAIKDAMSAMTQGLGADLPENPYEALLYGALDPAVNWTVPGQAHTEDGFRIIRIALMVTDDIGHDPGQGQEGIDLYNFPRYPKEEAKGFGAPTLLNSGLMVAINDEEENTKDHYREMCRLWYMTDEIDEIGEMTVPAGRLERLTHLRDEVFAPSVWEPQHLTPHSGLFEDNGCKTMEYPTPQQVAQALNKTGVTPVLLVTTNKDAGLSQEAQTICSEQLDITVTDPTGDDARLCLASIFERQFKNAGIDAIIGQFKDAGDITSLLTDVISQATAIECQKPEPPAPVPDTDNDGGNDSGDDKKEKKSNAGAIGGGIAGAGVGVAAVAGLFAWRRFKPKPVGVEAIQEAVNAPDLTVERETAAEIFASDML